MRTRILLGTVLLTAATIAAFFVPAAVALDDAEREAQELELQREAADAAALLGARRDEAERRDEEPERGPEEDEGDDAEEERDAPLGADEDHTFGLYGADGALVLGEGPARADEPVRAAIGGRTSTARVGDERVAAVPLSAGGALRAAEPAAEADDRARSAMFRLGLVAVAIVAAAAGAAWLLARRLSRPLRDLGRTAARLGGGDFTAQVAPTGLPEVDEVGSALNTTASRIGTLVERERRLTADTSHQMRTPLAGLRLALEAELAAPRPDAGEVLRESLGAVERLEAIVAALTDLARDEAPDTLVPIDEVAEAARQRWAAHLSRSGRALEVDAATGATVGARRAALDTIVDVLVDNALHHGTGTVTVATEAHDGSVRLVVADEGSCRLGDDALFARRRSGGGRTGIGLHLARTLAEAEGARLRLLERDPTAFQLLLAAAPASPVEVGAPRQVTRR